MQRKIILFTALLLLCRLAGAHEPIPNSGSKAQSGIIPGADRIDSYLPLIKDKRVGVFANQTSMVGNRHLVDTLRALGVDIKVIFGPEHGFRGTADAGEKVGNYLDEKTGIPVVSLYGSKRRPDAADLEEVDVLLFDIQDVGVRFYTFISSLEEFMLSAMEYKKPLIVLDRPNPNGHYVDGPVLDRKYRSFVGMQPVPVVYGMTIGEYARMLLGEKWVRTDAKSQNDSPVGDAVIPVQTGQGETSSDQAYAEESSLFSTEESGRGELEDKQFHLFVVRCDNYTHRSMYVLPVKPSPNLPNIQSIYLYPSTCFFEGTVLSEGRGTDKPFQVFGHPALPKNLFSFTPKPNDGAKNSKHYGKVCYGWDLSGTPAAVLEKVGNQVQLKWLMDAYKLFPKKDSFFLIPKSGNMEQSFFTKLAGNNELWQQIRQGKSEADIRKTWEPGLQQFRGTRKKYLLYEDFE